MSPSTTTATTLFPIAPLRAWTAYRYRASSQRTATAVASRRRGARGTGREAMAMAMAEGTMETLLVTTALAPAALQRRIG